MSPDRGPDYLALYSKDLIRQNANLSGDLVWPLSKIAWKSDDMRTRGRTWYSEEELMRIIPGYTLLQPYLELSVSEGMKRSNQTVQSFQASTYRQQIEAGLAPDLTPARPPAPAQHVVVQVGREEGKRGVDGLRKRFGL